MENISYEKLMYICEGQALHYDSEGMGSDWYKCYIRKDGIKYVLLCQIYNTTIESRKLRDEIYELKFSNALTIQWMNWDFYNLGIIHPGKSEKELIYIKDD